jgi:adenine-specific DNA-methyltransferase
LFGKGWFPFPKNTEVLAELIELTSGPSDLILDFFAGSGSAGHAVWKEDQVHSSGRHFVLVQLSEPTGKKTYATIADVAKQRLRRAGSNLRSDNPRFTGDLGFRVFKLASSNIRACEPDQNDLEQTLLDNVEHIKPDCSEQDVLYQLLLKLGLDLCVPIEQKTIADKAVHSIGGGVLLVCLAERIGREEVEPLATGIVEWQKEFAIIGNVTCVFRDSAFANNVAKTNAAAILQQDGIENVRSL